MKYKITLLFIIITTFCNAQIVTIPDANFKNALLTSFCVDADLNGTYESDADLNNDGQIQVSEASVIQRLKVSGKSIANLTGIQSFTNLKKLLCNNNLLTTVSFNTNLNLQQIDCYSNSFTSLTINGFPALTSLNVYPNLSLQTLTVTNNPLLTDLILTDTFGSLTSLTSLNCSHNALATLNLYSSSYPFANLTTVDCSYNQITGIAINPALQILNVSHNLMTAYSMSHQNITSLDISNNSLQSLAVYNCFNLSTLLYSGNPLLTSLGVNNNGLTSLSVHDLNYLQLLDCSFTSSGGTKLTSLEVYNLPALTSLSCYQNNIGNLTVANFPNLTTFIHFDNPSINLTLANLPGITNYEAESGNSITISSMPNLSVLTFDELFHNITVNNNNALTTLTFHQTSISQFQITNAPNLNAFYFSCIQSAPYNLNLNALPGLASIWLDINDNCNLSLTNLPALHDIEINNVSTFNFHDLPQLYSIKSQSGILASFTVNNLPNLHELLLDNNDLGSLTLQNLPNLYTVDVSDNYISTISLLNLPLLHDMNFEFNYTGQHNDVYSFSNLPALYDLNFNHTSVSSILLSNLPALHKFLLTSNADMDALDFSNLPALYDVGIIECSQLSSIVFNNLNSLYKVQIYHTVVPSLNFSNLPNLYDLNIESHSTITGNAIILNTLPNLFKLKLKSNNLTNYTFGSLPNLNELDISSNNLYTLNLSSLTNLRILNITGNTLHLVNLDLSSNPNINKITYSDGWYYDQLKYINLKNGSNTVTNITVGSSVTKICVDDNAEKVQLQSLDTSLNNTVFTTYCTFNPGGTFYTLQGNSLFDNNGNGCDAGDLIFPMIHLNITNGSVTNTHFANNSGSYSIPFTAGQYTITPSFENSGYYTFSPASVNVNFPTQTSPQIQNFCVTPNGVHNDLEIVLLPISSARPGLDASYKLIFKNKGNQAQSGTINLNFNDSVTDFVSANPAVSNQTANQLNWSYTNLQPFETREISVILNLNSPTETPAVTGGTILDFAANIIGLTDEHPADNSAVLKQTVVNSFDPNDKTCLEGATVSSSVIGEYVHYMVRFQNTGTANALNIVVKDMIDLAKFDITTLTPIKGSHTFYTRITGPNQVEFIFENINLPFAAGSNTGYISFKIKTKPTLVVGDSFSNLVNIYFDYNNPIVTNNYVSTIATLGIHDNEIKSKLSIYPNPVKDVVFFNTEEIVTKVEVYDIAGRILSSNSVTGNQVNLSELTTGNYILKVYTENGSTNTKIIKE